MCAALCIQSEARACIGSTGTLTCLPLPPFLRPVPACLLFLRALTSPVAVLSTLKSAPARMPLALMLRCASACCCVAADRRALYPLFSSERGAYLLTSCDALPCLMLLLPRLSIWNPSCGSCCPNWMPRKTTARKGYGSACEWHTRRIARVITR